MSDAGNAPATGSGVTTEIIKVREEIRVFVPDPASEVMRMMPQVFVDNYEALCASAFNAGGGMDGRAGTGGVEGEDPEAAIGKAEGRATGQWRMKSGEQTSIGEARPGKAQFKKVGKTGNGMRNERAFRLKTKIDKRLRGIARDIQASLYESDKTISSVRICSGRCKKIGDSDWLYCPRCGGPMAENDSPRG